MKPFTYHRPMNNQEALQQIAMSAHAKFIAGGTNLIDLMKENVERPDRLVDLNALNLKTIQKTSKGGLAIGALMTNSATAYHEEVEKNYPLLSEAILAGASPQLRNMATNGGNLLQRTRCYYFYDKTSKCNKREPGAGCDAISGYNRLHAVLGQSESCIAVHPSDMCVALAALGATVQVTGPNGDRQIAFQNFHLLPGATPQRETALLESELIQFIELPGDHFTTHYRYLKIRDRSSYAFALISVAAALELADGVVRKAQVAVGGVAHKPWRDFEAERDLEGQPAKRATFEEFARRVFSRAKGYEFNSFKIELGQRAIVRAMIEATQRGSEQ